MNDAEVLAMLEGRPSKPLRDLLNRLRLYAVYNNEVYLRSGEFDYLADQVARETGGRLNLAEFHPYGLRIKRLRF